MKHDELAYVFSQYLRSKGDRMIWLDMPMGSCGSVRPDVYSINKSFVRPTPMAYEIKVSKADFQSDMKTGKWQSYLKYACAVTFVVPDGLATKNDIPEGTGLIRYKEGGFRTLKAPRLERISLPQDLMLKLVIDGIDREVSARMPVIKERYQIELGIRKKLGEEVGKILSDREYALWELEQTKKRSKTEGDRIAVQTKEKREKAEQDNKGMYADICDILGVDHTANSFAIRAKIRDLKSQITESIVVDKLVRKIENMRRDIEDAVSVSDTELFIQEVKEDQHIKQGALL